jgi:hypothetical protein
MVVLTRLGVWSVAKLQAIIMAFVGLLVGLFFALITFALGPIAGVTGSTSGAGILAGLGFLSIIIFPVIYGLMGLVGGAIGAWIYNLIAGWFGGIEMEFKQ